MRKREGRRGEWEETTWDYWEAASWGQSFNLPSWSHKNRLWAQTLPYPGVFTACAGLTTLCERSLFCSTLSVYSFCSAYVTYSTWPILTAITVPCKKGMGFFVLWYKRVACRPAVLCQLRTCWLCTADVHSYGRPCSVSLLYIRRALFQALLDCVVFSL